MIHFKSAPFPILFLCLSLALTACASKQDGVRVEPKPGLSSSSVVLFDPTADDGMLPALGESLSKGAVTIYSLQGQAAAVPVGSAGGGAVVTPAYASPYVAPQTAAVTLRAPAGMGAGSGDPRVNIYSVTSGEPVNIAPPKPEILTPLPPLPPPAEVKPLPLQSPFNAKGEVVAKPVPMTGGGTVMGVGDRAVRVDTLLETESIPLPPPAPAVQKKRPPKGMTY